MTSFSTYHAKVLNRIKNSLKKLANVTRSSLFCRSFSDG